MSPDQSAPTSRQVTLPSLEPDTLPWDLADDSFKVQSSMINCRLDEFQREFLKSRGETEESSVGGSPFAQEIQDKPVLLNF